MLTKAKTEKINRQLTNISHDIYFGFVDKHYDAHFIEYSEFFSIVLPLADHMETVWANRVDADG